MNYHKRLKLIDVLTRVGRVKTVIDHSKIEYKIKNQSIIQDIKTNPDTTYLVLRGLIPAHILNNTVEPKINSYLIMESLYIKLTSNPNLQELTLYDEPPSQWNNRFRPISGRLSDFIYKYQLELLCKNKILLDGENNYYLYSEGVRIICDFDRCDKKHKLEIINLSIRK